MSYKLRVSADQNAEKGETLFLQGRYEEAISYLRRSVCFGRRHKSHTLLAYCHYKGLGTPIDHYVAYKWYRELLCNDKDGVGIKIAQNIFGKDFDKINTLQYPMTQSNRYEFYDYTIGRVVVRSDTGRERVQFYADRVEVEVSHSDLYDSSNAIESIYDLHESKEKCRKLPQRIDETFRRDYDHFALCVQRGNNDKYTHKVAGHCYTIITPKNINFDLIVTREAIICEGLKHMRRAALKYIPKRMKELSEQTGLKYNDCKVINLSDCSYRGVYNPNTGVITIDTHSIKWSTKVIDALIIHELCHSLHLGHEQIFYDTMLQYGGKEILNIDKKCYPTLPYDI